MKQGPRIKLPLLLGVLAGCLLLAAAAGLIARWAWGSRHRLVALLPIPIPLASATVKDASLPAPTGSPSATLRPPLGITPQETSEEASGPIPSDLPVATPHPALVITPQETSEESQSPRYSIQATWPILEWGGDPRVQAFNRAVETMVREEIQTFKDGVLKLPDDPALSEYASSLQISYTTQNYDRGILSVLLRISFYSAGAAHPGSYFRAVNYDLREGKELALADLFQPGADYLSLLSSACLEDLQNRHVLGWEEGALPKEENFRNWNVTPGGLLITFDEYQVAPYALGPQSVIIPYETLSELLRPDGPLSGFLDPQGQP